jgi:thiopeptide-type bacteriocin biosynthesis protein
VQTIWLIALKSMNDYIDLLDLDSETKREYLSNVVKSRQSAFKFNDDYNKQLNNKYRTYKSLIIDFLRNNDNLDVSLQTYMSILENRNKLLAPYLSKLRRQETTENVLSFLESCIHMSVNRFFRSQNNLQEFFLYFFLEKYCREQFAFNKKNE